MPNVAIAYGHLSDASITNGIAPRDPALERYAYLAQADPTNGCAYPRSCAVGSRRVVTGYVSNNDMTLPVARRVRREGGDLSECVS